jgi:hypothetical protein
MGRRGSSKGVIHDDLKVFPTSEEQHDGTQGSLGDAPYLSPMMVVCVSSDSQFVGHGITQ